MLEIEASPSEKPKITRSVRLDPELDDQLVLVCKTLGVNPNAYLRQVVGEAINKHLSQYRIEQGLIQAVNAQMAKMFEMMAEQEGQQDDHTAKPHGRQSAGVSGFCTVGAATPARCGMRSPEQHRRSHYGLRDPR